MLLYVYRMSYLTKRAHYCLDFKYLGVTNKLLSRMYRITVNVGSNNFVNPNDRIRYNIYRPYCKGWQVKLVER